MMTRLQFSQGVWLAGLVSSLVSMGARGGQAIAQVLPDKTLGNSSSVVRSINQQTDQIEGGAIRGKNLFHSFQSFNIPSSQSVYFANPAQVENILSRVTGESPSQIDGTLGVRGSANLFFLNPRGIVFGPQSQLDIQGSFYGLTAEGIALGDRGSFNAIEPQRDRLVSVSPSAFFFNQVNQQSGVIINQGQLKAGQDLMLQAYAIGLQGNIKAGQNLTLKSQGPLIIRDTAQQVFTAEAGENLLIQADNINIATVNHSESGLFSGKELTLRSDNFIIGDTHYWSGDQFRIEHSDGSLGNLGSRTALRIRAGGTVAMKSFVGASLHIIAGESVFIPDTIWVNSTNNSDTATTETINLSDGSSLNIDSSTRATLDIRAGSSTVEQSLNNKTNPKGSVIEIGNIVAADDSTNVGGQVFLTNAYLPQTRQKSPGTITVNQINTLYGGPVTIDSIGSVEVETLIDTSSSMGQGGDITLISGKNTSLKQGAGLFSLGSSGGNIFIKSNGSLSLTQSEIRSNSLSQSDEFSGGRVEIDVDALELNKGSLISASTQGASNSGLLKITAKDIKLSGTDDRGVNSRIVNSVGSRASGNSVGIEITGKSLILENGARIQSSTAGNGNAGPIRIRVADEIILSGENKVSSFSDNQNTSSTITNDVAKGANGDSNIIDIQSGSLSLAEGAIISSTTKGTGNSGIIKLNARDRISLSGVNSNNISSSILNEVRSGSKGNAGGIDLKGGKIELSDRAIISTNTFSQGNSGPIKIISEKIALDDESQITSNVGSKAIGSSGGVRIKANEFSLAQGSHISASSFGQGDAGKIKIDTSDHMTLSEASHIISQLNTDAQGKRGQIALEGKNIILSDQAFISASTFGKGDAGPITIKSENISLNNSEISTNIEAKGIGASSDINIVTQKLVLKNRSQLTTSTFGHGNSGAITINAEKVRLKDKSQVNTQVSPDAIGMSKGIKITANQLSLSDESQLLTQTLGQGDAGLIQVNTGSVLLKNGSGLVAGTQGKGNGGSILIKARDLVSLSGEGPLFTNSDGLSRTKSSTITTSSITSNQRRKSGRIDIETTDLILQDGAGIGTVTTGDSNAGLVRITARDEVRITGRNSSNREATSNIMSSIGPSASGDSDGVEIRAKSLHLIDGAVISAFSQGKGDAGNVQIKADRVQLKDGALISSTAGDPRIPSDSEIFGNAGRINIGPNLRNNVVFNFQDSGLITSSAQSLGGDITIRDAQLTVQGDSLIQAVSLSGQKAGDIQISGPSAILTDNSDVVSLAVRGEGGDIAIQPQVFLANGYSPLKVPLDPRSIESMNNRVDINATGTVLSGAIQTPDISFIQNSLSDLPENLVNTDQLLSRSCLAQSTPKQGKFFMTGTKGLPTQPGDAYIIPFKTVPPTVDQTVQSPDKQPQWKIGDPIIEPEGIYTLHNGTRVLSQPCSNS